MAFPYPPGGRGGQNNQNMSDQDIQVQKTVAWVNSASESCLFKAGLACGAGFALGGLFGLFMASMSYDTMSGSGAQKLADMPFRQQMREGLRDMGKRSYSSAKGFAMVGMLFSGTECVIEGYRAKNDMANPIAAGCITGGILARSTGPVGVGMGCAGFAAFSTAIEYYLRSD